MPDQSELQAVMDEWVEEEREARERRDQTRALTVDSTTEPDPTLGEIEVPAAVEESSIEDENPEMYDGDDNGPTTYVLITYGTQKGKEKLADSNGYTYTVKTRRRNGNKHVWCKASVL
jgi:hypothetical protein